MTFLGLYQCIFFFLLMISGYMRVSASQEDNATTVYRFQEDGVQSHSYVLYAADLSTHMPLTTISICFRLKLFYVWDVTGLLVFRNAKDTKDTLNVEISPNYVRLAIGSFRRYHMFPKPLRLQEWYYICLTYGNSIMKAYLDGQVYSNSSGSIYQPLTGAKLKLGAWDALQSFSGEITELNVWSQVITDTFIARISQCKNTGYKGDVVDWNGLWDQPQGDVKELSLNREDLCRDRTPFTYAVFPSISGKATFPLCDRLGGEAVILDVKQKIDNINTYIESIDSLGEHKCEKVWAGITDDEEENKWVHYQTGEDIYPNWRQDAPDGGRLQNCAYASSKISALVEGRPVFADISCSKPLCGACLIPTGSLWKIRGSCQEKNKDSTYLIVQDYPGHISFQGYSSYQIEKDTNSDAWLWKDRSKDLTLARLEQRDLKYPMGRHSWILNQPVCQSGTGEELLLLLTSCEEGSFSCDDGTCIPLYQRCDLKFDCRDKSDENGCKIVNIPKLYRSDIPPSVKTFGTSSSRKGETESLPVGVYMQIDNLGVDSSNMLLHSSFNLSMTWNEGRVSYSNLNKDFTLNRVPQSLKERLWSPKLDFTNTPGNQYTKTDSEAVMSVSLQGKPTFGMDDIAEEVEIYSGNENPLTIRRKYSLTFQCQFNLAMYPFDKQACHMELTMLSASSRLLTFDEDAAFAFFEGDRDLVEYTIGHISLTFDNESDFAALRVEISLRRRAGFILLNVYIPSMLLLMICYTTLYFKPSIFQVRIIGSLTTLLVMVTLFTQASSSLPKTSYFKLVDVWLISCIVVIFFVIICHVIIDHFLEPGGTESQKLPNGNTNEVCPSPARSNQKAFGTPEKVIRVASFSPEIDERKVNNQIVKKRSFSRKIIIGSRAMVIALLLLFNAFYWAFVLTL